MCKLYFITVWYELGLIMAWYKLGLITAWYKLGFIIDLYKVEFSKAPSKLGLYYGLTQTRFSYVLTTLYIVKALWKVDFV